jgi:hypothetical protein
MFRHAVLASGDVATILLQVDNARHFRELLGNYSRWHFHHPGPGFMYLLALGDLSLRDVLRVAPGPLNSATLTLLLIYTCFLFGSIWLLQQHSESPWFLPTAVAASLWFIYVIDRTFPGSASGAVWMPYPPLFCFLFFMTACASLAVGKSKCLPLVAASGMLLIHAHVIQTIFVAILSSAALVIWLVPEVRITGVGATINKHRVSLIISLGIVVAFAFPILLEAALHHPNNLDDIRSYMQTHPGPQNSWLTSIKYVASFVAFIPDPEVVLSNPAAHLLSRATARPYVLTYWAFFVVLLGLAAGRCARTERVPHFIKYIVCEIVCVTILVTYWARKIAGGLYNFNAYFFFATFLLGSFVLLSFLLSRQSRRRGNLWSLIVACVLPFVMLGAPREFMALQGGAHPEGNETQARNITGIVSALPLDTKTLRIRWDRTDEWPIAAGVASWLQQRRRPFCVSDNWGFVFGRQHVCRNLASLEDLTIVSPLDPCVAPCRPIFRSEEIAANLIPVVPGSLPITLHSDDPASLAVGFYEPEGKHGPMWSALRSEIHFLLETDWHPTKLVLVRVTGVAIPDRPVQLSLNGQYIGTISRGGLGSFEFAVPESLFHGGTDNALVFDVDRAAPVGRDPRNLGFQLWQIQLLPRP